MESGGGRRKSGQLIDKRSKNPHKQDYSEYIEEIEQLKRALKTTRLSFLEREAQATWRRRRVGTGQENWGGRGGTQGTKTMGTGERFDTQKLRLEQLIKAKDEEIDNRIKLTTEAAKGGGGATAGLGKYIKKVEQERNKYTAPLKREIEEVEQERKIWEEEWARRVRDDVKKSKKKRTTGFLLFANDHRGQVKRDNEGILFDQLGKKLVEMWRGLGEDEKSEYIKNAKAKNE